MSVLSCSDCFWKWYWLCLRVVVTCLGVVVGGFLEVWGRSWELQSRRGPSWQFWAL